MGLESECQPRTRALERFADLVFGENSRCGEIVCLGDFEALLCRGWLTDLWWRSYDLQLHASYRLYLFPTFSLVLPAPRSASTSALPNWQWVLPTRHIVKFGARIGYEGQRNSVRIHPNLGTAGADSEIVTVDIKLEYQRGRLELYTNEASLPEYYTASPLDKADGSKRRIHHLTYPSSDTSSINSGITESYGTIMYSTIDEAILAIRKYGKNC